MRMDPTSAELVKLGANGLLATKITFANELANLCDRVGAAIDDVVGVLCETEDIGKHFLRRANHSLEHPFVGIFSRAFRELNDERRLTLFAAAEEPEELLHVVNIIGADGEFSVGDVVELLGGDDHKSVAD